MKETFKVYIKQVKDGKFIKEIALTNEYTDLKTAIRAGKKYLATILTDESTFCVRRYNDAKTVIMSNDIYDTGALVFTYKNYLEVARDKDDANKVRKNRKPVRVTLDELGYSVYDFSIDQMEQILLGDAHNINYILYAKPQYDARKMMQVRHGLEEAAKEDVSKIQEETVRRQLKAMKHAIEAGTLIMPVVVSAIMDTFADKDSEVMRGAFMASLPDEFKREIKEDVEMGYIREDVKSYCTEHQLPCTDKLTNKVAERWVKAGDYDCNADYWSNISVLIDEESEKLGLSKEKEDIELD